MSFIRQKEIPPGSGNHYSYLVENRRVGGKVRQFVLQYLGTTGHERPVTAMTSHPAIPSHSLGTTQADKTVSSPAKINPPIPLTNSSNSGIVGASKGEEKKMDATVALDYRGRKNYLVTIDGQLYYKDAEDGSWHAINEWEPKSLFKTVTTEKESVDVSALKSDVQAKKARIQAAGVIKTNNTETTKQAYETAKAVSAIKNADLHALLTQSPEAESELQTLERRNNELEKLRDYPGDYFPARDKVRVAFNVWGEKHPAILAARRAASHADSATEQAKQEYEMAKSEALND
jgi:hypothetical protein